MRAHLALGRKLYGEAYAIINTQLARQNLSTDERGALLMDLCVVHRGIGSIKEALQTALELRELWRQTGARKSSLARAEHNVGNLYGELGKWEESLSHIEAALELYR